MSKRYITPKEHTARVENACRLALVAFEDCDIDNHLNAVDQLYALGEDEKAKHFIQTWNEAEAMSEEIGRTLTTAYAQAQGYARVY